MDGDEIIAFPVRALVTRVAPFSLSSVPAPVTVPASTVIPADVPNALASSVNATAVAISVLASHALSVPIAVESPVLAPSPVLAVQATPQPVVPPAMAEISLSVPTPVGSSGGERC